MKEVGERIANRRKFLNYSQENLATLTGISRGSIANYETGGNLPSLEIIVKISEVLGTTTDYILKGIESEADSERPSLDNLIIRNQQKLIEAYENQLKELKGKAKKGI